MIKNSILAGLFIALGFACSSPEKKQYTRLARELNPIITAMRSAAARILAANPGDHAEVIAACWSVDDQLALLRDIKADVHNYKSIRVANLAHIALSSKPYVCEPTADRVEPCSRSCLDTWNAMIAAVERVRVAASIEGVEVVSLDPSPTGSPR